MICKKCGTANSNDSLFCKQCGTKLERKKFCTTCGTENDADGKFCKKCGSSLEQGQSGSTSKSVDVDQTATTTTVAQPTAEAESEIVVKPVKWKKIVEYISWGAAMASLLFTFIFTFCIGIKYKTVAVNTILDTSNRTVFYFLFSVYANMYKPSVDTILPPIFGTLVSLAVLITVITLTVISIVRFVNYARGKSDKDFAKPVISAYLVFVMGASMLLGLFYMSSQYRGESVLDVRKVYLSLTPATVAGIVLGGLCLFVFIALRVAVKGKELARKENILRIVFGAVAIIICGTLLGILAKGAISRHESDGSYLYKESFSLFYFLSSANNVYPGNTMSTTSWSNWLAMVVGMFGHMVQMSMIALVAVTLMEELLYASGKTCKRMLRYSIPLVVLSFLYFVISVTVFSIACEQFMWAPLPFVIFVVALINLAASITQKVLLKKLKPAQVVEEGAQEVVEKDVTSDMSEDESVSEPTTDNKD